MDIRQQDLENWRQETECSDMAFVASAAKRQPLRGQNIYFELIRKGRVSKGQEH